MFERSGHMSLSAVVVPISSDAKIPQLNGTLDDEPSVENCQGRRIHQAVLVVQDGFRDDKDIVKEEQESVFYGIRVDDLENRRGQQQFAGRIFDWRRK